MSKSRRCAPKKSSLPCEWFALRLREKKILVRSTSAASPRLKTPPGAVLQRATWVSPFSPVFGRVGSKHATCRVQPKPDPAQHSMPNDLRQRPREIKRHRLPALVPLHQKDHVRLWL